MKKPFDPNHIYKTAEERKAEEAKEIWEKLKHVDKPFTVDSEEIINCLKRINVSMRKSRVSFEKMEDSLDKISKNIKRIMENLNEKK